MWAGGLCGQGGWMGDNHQSVVQDDDGKTNIFKQKQKKLMIFNPGIISLEST